MKHFQRATENQSILSLSVKVSIILPFVAFVFLALQGPALAGDYFGEGLAAYNSRDYTTALTQFTSLVAQPSPQQSVPLDEFMAHVKPLNPQASTEELAAAWSRMFGPDREATVAKAQYYIGLMHDRGLGVPQDDRKAIGWYAKAAEAGDVEAQHRLVVMSVTDKDRESEEYQQAVQWFRKAAEHGNVTAQVRLGRAYWEGKGVQLDPQQAVQWFRKAADRHLDAQYYLGRAYWEGKGVQLDPQQAAQWFRKAAEHEDADSQFYLGLAYSQGKGVLQDYQQALHWYRRAANQGSSSAQNNLGRMYGEGEGIPQDYVQAHKWYNLAASAATTQEDRELSVKNRDLIERRMSPAQVAEAQRLAREWKPTTDPSSDDHNKVDPSVKTDFIRV